MSALASLAKGLVKQADEFAPAVAKQVLNFSGGSASLVREMPTRPGSFGKYLTQGEFDVVQPQRIDIARDKVDLASETLQNIEEANPGVPKNLLKADRETGYASAQKQKKKAQALVSSEESNILTPTPENQYAFPADTKRAKEMKVTALEENEKLGREFETLEMHHLFPKGTSAAIYNRIRDFIQIGEASSKDLKRISTKFKKVTGVDTGDLESNILAMRKTPHSTFHGEMRYQPSWAFKGQKMEMTKEALAKELRKVKSMKQLEALLDQILENDVKPLIENARNWEKMDDVIKSISPEYTGKARYKPPK